jgi:polysaccharide export outer membrane protein
MEWPVQRRHIRTSLMNQRWWLRAVTIIAAALAWAALLATRLSGLGHVAATPPASAPPDCSSSSAETPPNAAVQTSGTEQQFIQLCQACSPAAPYAVDGIDCLCNPCCEAHWDARRPIPWQVFAQGEYVGPARLEHVPEYRIRVDDVLECIYRLTRNESLTPYRLNVGDTVRVESITDEKIDRDLVIQPDGSITLRLVGQVRAGGRTVEELSGELEEQYKQYYKVPAITVTPVKVDTKLEDLRAAVDSQFGAGRQTRRVRVTPEGTVQLPAIGSVPAQGLTMDELKREIEERYALIVEGIEITPVLFERAPRFLYVIGEVRTPGRFDLTGPTTLMQAIALAGGWNNGGNLREIVVFRRAEDWRLIATRIDIRGALLGQRPCPADEIWLRDSDIVVVPKMPIQLLDDFIELVFTRGIYGVIPLSTSINIASSSTL